MAEELSLSQACEVLDIDMRELRKLIRQHKLLVHRHKTTNKPMVDGGSIHRYMKEVASGQASQSSQGDTEGTEQAGT